MSGLSKTKKNNSKIIAKHQDDAAFSEHAREKFGKTAAAQAEILNVSSEEDNVSDADLQSLNPNTQDYISEQKIVRLIKLVLKKFHLLLQQMMLKIVNLLILLILMKMFGLERYRLRNMMMIHIKLLKKQKMARKL